MRRFHTLIRDKGRKCSLCHTHTEKSYLPLQELGFSEHRIADLTNLNIIGVVEKYLDFYLPDLLKHDVQYPGGEIPDGDNDKTGPAATGDEATNTGNREIP